MQKITLSILLLAGIGACSPQETTKMASHKLRPVPNRLREVYQISQQTSYPLFDCDTTLNEIRVWESGSLVNSTAALFLKDHTISTQRYYLEKKNDLKGVKVVDIVSSQERIIDVAAEKKSPVFESQGAPALTCRRGVEVAIDSLFKLGFANMQSQAEEESRRVGDGIEYIIEVRRGRFYKCVYYASPEFFKSESAQKFKKIYLFLTQERWRPGFAQRTKQSI